MMNQATKNKFDNQFIYFLILSFRWYLIFYMLSYGYHKLTLSQFYVSPENLTKPITETNPFYAAWYVFGSSVFYNISAGLIECIGAILLLFNRTVLMGTFVVLATLLNILIIDISFTTGMFGCALVVRIIGMILSCLIILYYYKEKLIVIWNILKGSTATKFKLRWYILITLPLVGFLMDFIIGLILTPLKYLLNYFLR